MKKVLVRDVSIIVAAIVIGGSSVYGVMKYQESHSKQSAVLAAQAESDQVIGQVGKLMVLPTGEMPTIATVSDITKLKGQQFFVKAQNGDKVLIYTQAKQAILFRPSTNKIVEVAPVNLQSTPTPGSQAEVNATPALTETPTPTIVYKPKPTDTPVAATPALKQ